jgi:pilus assembly protein TadC
MTTMLLAGLLIGTGVFLIIRVTLPAQPSLDAALDRMLSPVLHTPDGKVDWRTRAARRLAVRISGSVLDLRIPRKDLAILDRTVEGYLVQKITFILGGLLGPALLCLIIQAPLSISVLGTLAFTAYVFVIPDVVIRSNAKDARHDFRVALTSYLELIGLASSAGKGPTEALEAPAQIGNGWVFQRLASVLDPARRGTRDTWNELERLADEIGVQELADIAVISRRAGAQGASVLDSIRAKAASLRADQHAIALTKAKSATETMTVPMVLIVIGFMILIGFPAFTRIGG